MGFFKKEKEEAIPDDTSIANALSRFEDPASENSFNILRRLSDTEISGQFHATRSVGKYLEIDEDKQLWRSCVFSEYTLFSFSDILSFKLLENNGVITEGGIGSALVGGALFGATGAVVGAVVGKNTESVLTDMHISVSMKHVTHSQVDIYIVKPGHGCVSSSGLEYSKYRNIAQEVLSLLTIMTQKSDQEKQIANTENIIQPSSADEIRKFKQLLDEGIISEEEFNLKKKQLIGL